jgi:pantetheine-phosphate adenylyltransferase
MKKVIYAGSFDPIHLGHIDIIERAISLFSSRKVTVIIANNRSKKHSFNIKDRMSIVQSALSHLKGKVDIISFEGIISDYANHNDADVMIRGIRNGTDLDYEFNLEQFTRKTSKMETSYLTPNNEHINTSSSLIRMFLDTDNLKQAKQFMNKKSFNKMKEILNG